MAATLLSLIKVIRSCILILIFSVGAAQAADGFFTRICLTGLARFSPRAEYKLKQIQFRDSVEAEIAKRKLDPTAAQNIRDLKFENRGYQKMSTNEPNALWDNDAFGEGYAPGRLATTYSFYRANPQTGQITSRAQDFEMDWHEEYPDKARGQAQDAVILGNRDNGLMVYRLPSPLSERAREVLLQTISFKSSKPTLVFSRPFNAAEAKSLEVLHTSVVKLKRAGDPRLDEMRRLLDVDVPPAAATDLVVRDPLLPEPPKGSFLKRIDLGSDQLALRKKADGKWELVEMQASGQVGNFERALTAQEISESEFWGLD